MKNNRALEEQSTLLDTFQDNYIARNLLEGLRAVWGDRLAKLSLIWLTVAVLGAIVGPYLAPYSVNDPISANGELLILTEPSLHHPLGTTDSGRDVLSRLLVGFRPSMITAFVGGTIIITLGTSVGLTAGYIGGKTDSFLMRLTDFAFSIPLIPFAIVLLGFLDVGFFTSIIVIGAILWRGSARVIRGEVQKIKNRPYIKSSRALGSSRISIVLKHILPNIAPMIVLFYAIGMGISIIFQAGLAFVGMTSPFVPSWGIMLRNAYNSGFMTQAWWWTIPPGLMISFTVLAMFLLGRRYEAVTSDDYELNVEGEAT